MRVLTGALLCALLTDGRTQVTPQLIEDAGFVPSGWMGDAAKPGVPKESQALQLDARSMVQPHSAPYSLKWTYHPDPHGEGWAAVAWQFPENNWGDKPGRNWSRRGYTKVTVWARGVADHGQFPKVQFKAGGGTAPPKKFQASFEAMGDFLTLTEDWRQYTLDLRGKNLSQVICAFVLVLRAQGRWVRGRNDFHR